MSAADMAGALGLSAPVGDGTARIAAFVGGGGKTSALFAAAESASNLRVIVTTTTHIRDPRVERGRRFGTVLILPALAREPGTDAELPEFPVPERGAPPLVIGTGVKPELNQLTGVHPRWVEHLARVCDLVLVEADGSKMLPIKAPAEHEPVVPPSADILVGVVGMDCLGKPLGPDIAHRPEILGPLTGCDAGQAIEPRHVAALIRSPLGLFKGCPPGCRRAALLNKADTAREKDIRRLLELLRADPGPADILLAGSLVRGEIRTLAVFDKTNAKDRPGKEGHIIEEQRQSREEPS